MVITLCHWGFFYFNQNCIFYLKPLISDDWKTFQHQISKEKTFLIDKDDKKVGWKCPDLQTQFILFSKFANSGSDGIQITLRKVFGDLHYSIPRSYKFYGKFQSN